MMGQPVGAAVQFSVAEGLSFKHHGSSVRRQRSLLLKQFMDQGFLREISLGSVKVCQQLLLLCDRQHRQGRNSLCDIGGHRRQDLLKVARYANHGRLIKQVGRIFQPSH